MGDVLFDTYPADRCVVRFRTTARHGHYSRIGSECCVVPSSCPVFLHPSAFVHDSNCTFIVVHHLYKPALSLSGLSVCPRNARPARNVLCDARNVTATSHAVAVSNVASPKNARENGPRKAMIPRSIVSIHDLRRIPMLLLILMEEGNSVIRARHLHLPLCTMTKAPYILR